MDVVTRWRLLTGAARPYLGRKLREALARPGAVRQAMQRLPTPASECTAPRTGLMPLPSAAWQERFLEDAAAFARRVWRGDIRAYGVAEYLQGPDAPVALDPRGVLEVARMHQWPAYALAALHARQRGAFTEAEEWYDRFVTEVRQFGQQHRPFESPLWSVAMDSAIRLVNLLVANDWFQQLQQPTANSQQHQQQPTATAINQQQQLSALAQDHAVVIEATLETAGGMATSHLLGDLMGLIAVDLYAGRHPARLVDLVREVSVQLLPDGMSFEASTGYHRQVTDILASTAVLLRASGVDVPDVFRDRVRGAVNALRTLEQAGMPLIGDNDDGMVLKLTGFTTNTALLHEWFPESTVDSPLHHFPDFGLSLYQRSTYQLTARCGPIGQYGKGGHAHNDQNAITLRVDGVPVIVDPGSCWYAGDPEQRNRDRSVAGHATVRINGQEQHRLPVGGGSALWWLVPRVTSAIEHCTADSWIGVVTYPEGIHRRTLTLSDDRIDGTDEIPEGCTAEIRFPTTPGTTIRIDRTSAHLSRNGVHLRITWDNSCVARIASNDVRVARAFGQADVADVLILDMKKSRTAWCLVPGA